MNLSAKVVIPCQTAKGKACMYMRESGRDRRLFVGQRNMCNFAAVKMLMRRNDCGHEDFCRGNFAGVETKKQLKSK